MTKKPFKVFSTTALAAAFAVSAIAPVAAAELPVENTLTISDVIVEIDGVNVAIPLEDYLDLLAAEKIAGTQAKFVKSNGVFYSMDDYLDASAAVGVNPTPAQILEFLSNAEDVEQDIDVVEVDYDENGNPIPGESVEEPGNEVEEALTAATDAVEALPAVEDVTVADKAAVAAAAVLVADAKELGADVAALEATVAALEVKIAELEAALEAVSVESVMATNATTLTVTLSDETTHEVTLDTPLVANTATEVTFTIDEVEYTATATWVVELTIEDVSVISKTGVTVVFKEITEAQKDVTVEVKDPTGKVLEVKALDLAVGDTEVYFAFKTPVTGDLESGMWTVNGVNYDQAALDAVSAVKSASTQSTLLTALQSSYFKNVDSANIVEYSAELSSSMGDIETVADVQKLVIDAGNTKATQDAYTQKIKDAVTATNQIELLTQLKAAGYERIVDANVANLSIVRSTPVAINATANGYLAGMGAISTPVTIQTAVDTANAAIATAYVDGVVVKSLVRADYNAAVAQVNNLTATSQKAAKTALEAKLVTVDKLIKLTEAQTNSAFNTALTEVSKLTGYTAGSPIFAVNNGAYKTAIQALVVTNRDDATKISTEVAAVNVTESAKPFSTAKLAEVVAYDNTDSADVAKFDKWLKDIDARVPNATFDYSKDVEADMLKTYITDVKADIAVGITDAQTGLVNAAALHTVIDDANTASLTTAVAAVIAEGDVPSDAATLLEALSSLELGLKNVNEANAAAYFRDAATELVTAKITGTDAAKKVKIQAVVDATNGTVKFNAASTATQAANAITGIAIANGYTDLVDLPSAARIDLAEMLLELKPSGGFQTTEALTDELGVTAAASTGTIGTNSGTSLFEVYDTVLTNVNTAGPDSASISGLVTALTSMDYDAFKDLDALEKSNVAESMITNWSKAGDPLAQVDFKTWSAVRTAIDAAIAQ